MKLINYDDLLERLSRVVAIQYTTFMGGVFFDAKQFVEVINNMPIIEQKTGKWLLNGGRPCECSICHHEGNEYGDANFCAYCGAKMVKERDDHD